MRRKIAKRRRRDILRKGGIIRREGWLYDHYPDGYKEKIGYEAHVEYYGWVIFAGGRDELDAYKIAIRSMPWCEENQKDENNGYLQISEDKKAAIKGIWAL